MLRNKPLSLFNPVLSINQVVTAYLYEIYPFSTLYTFKCELDLLLKYFIDLLRELRLLSSFHSRENLY